VSNSTKITRLTIENPKEEPFSFLGIVISEPDYTLSLRINRKLGISLRHSDDEIIVKSESSSASFSKFITANRRYALVSNKSEKDILISKLNKIDFLFLFGTNKQKEIDVLVGLLREIQGVTAVFIFRSPEVKDKNIDLLKHLTE
jgi:hypothetical protein